MYSADLLEDSEVDLDDYSVMNDSFDRNKEIKFKVQDLNQVDDVCSNIDQLVENLLNIAIPRLESNQIYSANLTSQIEDANFPKTFADEQSSDFQIRLIKPELLNKMVEGPLHLVINMLHIDDEGFQSILNLVISTIFKIHLKNQISKLKQKICN